MTTTPEQDLTLALAELRRARDVALQNAPLHAAAGGDTAQAELCRDVAEQCSHALLRLS